MNDQAQKLREMTRNHEFLVNLNGIKIKKEIDEVSRCKSIAITSGKGGVGKTNIALSLAVILASFGKKVLLLDADLGLANVHILLGLAPKNNLSHFFDEVCTLEQVIIRGPGGIDILPGACGLEKLANMDQGRIELLQRSFMSLERNYDYMIIDTGAGIGANVIRFVSKADIPIIVMSPEPTSLADAYSMVKVLYDRGVKRIETLVNMAVSDRDGIETFDRLNALVVKFLKIPLQHLGNLLINREIPICVRKQRLLVLEKSNNTFTLKIQTICRKLNGLPQVNKKGFFGNLW